MSSLGLIMSHLRLGCWSQEFQFWPNIGSVLDQLEVSFSSMSVLQFDCILTCMNCQSLHSSRLYTWLCLCVQFEIIWASHFGWFGVQSMFVLVSILGIPLLPNSLLWFIRTTSVFWLFSWIKWASRMYLSRLNCIPPLMGLDRNLGCWLGCTCLWCLAIAFDCCCLLISSMCCSCLLWKE